MRHRFVGFAKTTVLVIIEKWSSFLMDKPGLWGLFMIICLLAGTIPVGCGRQASPSVPTSTANPGSTNWEPFRQVREFWYLQSLLGENVGYERISVRSVGNSSSACREVEGEVVLRVKRMGTPVSVVTRYRSVETCEGRPREFTVTVEQGRALAEYRGRVSGRQLVVETVVAGRTARQTFDLPEDCRGFLGLQDWLWEKNMRPGEVREFSCLMLGVNGVCQARAHARDYEAVQVSGRETRLLRIDILYTLPGNQRVEQTVWSDSSGMIVKQRMNSPPVEAVLVPKERALQTASSSLDLIEDIRIPARAPGDLTKAHRATYHIKGSIKGLAELLATGVNQQVRRLGDDILELTVTTRGPGGNSGTCGDQATPEEQEPSLWIQSDASEIRAIAQSIAHSAKEPASLAVALERYVFHTVRHRDYNQAFLSALDVLKTKEGDCTEHAVLLAALARASSIPSRVAVGLVYHRDAFYYHMWTELLIDRCWIGFDATRGNGGIHAGYIKFGHDSLAGSDALGAFLPLTKLLGQIKIEIVKVEGD
ncbi:transglutaminase-like domain-containing protein [Thermogutta sp.]|uniref:transglutaminase-like domain-containing protein n=1 Tax=Thermogutta sp. TaxID=1962930 RepID=UPI003C7E312F